MERNSRIKCVFLALAVIGAITILVPLNYSNRVAGSTRQDSVISGVKPQVLPARACDFDGDGKTDLSVWRIDSVTNPNNPPFPSYWFILNSSNASTSVTQWGVSTPGAINGMTLTDRLVPGDYDGDGKTDIAVHRPSTGTWYIINSSDGSTTVRGWGQDLSQSHYLEAPGDYDGDGKTDIAVYQLDGTNGGLWYIVNSSDSSVRLVQWGRPGSGGDHPVPADYDGDGKADVAIARIDTARVVWYIVNSSDSSVKIMEFGGGGAIPVPGDYDEDGKTDIAEFYPVYGTWYIIKSSDDQVAHQGWGQQCDKPVPGDYDGDGKTDIAVYRPGTGTWYILNSSDGSARIAGWGIHGQEQFNTVDDIPIPGAYEIQNYVQISGNPGLCPQP